MPHDSAVALDQTPVVSRPPPPPPPLLVMKISSLLTHLPHTLLVTSLAFAANALPVESVELLVLTPENFAETIAHGVW